MGHLGQWYYARVPDVVLHAHVFTRGTGGNEVGGDARVYALIDEVARQQVPAVFWFQGALLLVASLIILSFLFSSRSIANHDCPAHHR